jgi:hypothetical protein
VLKLRFSFTPGNITYFKSYFKHSVDFLDFYVTDSSLYVISNTVELYSHLVFDILSKEDFKGVTCFRVDRKQFLNLLAEGVVSFFISGLGTVEMTFKPSKGSPYSVKVVHQNSDTSSISDKMGLLAEGAKFKPLKLRRVESAIKMVRDTVKIISVIDGMVVASTDHTRVFYKTDCENFNLYAVSAQHLLNHSDQIYKYQNFVIGRGVNCVIIARQVNNSSGSEYRDILERKYTISMELNLASVCNLADRCGEGEFVSLDFERETAIIRDGRSSFTTSFKASNIKSLSAQQTNTNLEGFDFNNFEAVSLTSVHKLPILVVPIKVVRDLLGTVAHETIKLKIKKDFVQFEVRNDIYVVVRRKDELA